MVKIGSGTLSHNDILVRISLLDIEIAQCNDVLKKLDLVQERINLRTRLD